MTEAILILAVLFLAFVALGVYATVKVVKAAKRGVDRTITQARRTVEDTTLRAKSYGPGGVTPELAQLRLSLRTSMRATQEALEAGAAEDASLKESLELFRRLSAHGHELDADLKRLERDPDRAGVAAQLGELRERTERITHAAESLRWAARDRARKFADDELASLSAQIDVEAGALRHWSAPEQDDLSWPEAAGQPAPAEETRQADAGGRSGAQAAAGGGAPQGDAPKAITAQDPRQQTFYSWQKSTRPETTN
ncbi:hypothetical protein E2C00_07040 [Streptomyces sp. WAC05374]|uniref:hypothetical protein n=1 Tax=Streptomyces sp. WAC05374 TaxID=2487420 RepID=UPI000F8712F3|nr:hypothetical protein [Streptomyces sp. WAC05374]RST14072.1 hypothetical protein EF905_18450 [Streptomyces sp. WAC05374]TDF45327.1 hypothetical protein E2B92_13550 [Streptomyces sp. WAC05374]TDF55685.1 hypothetical protein E2C02_14150 [Streptomyces sp. WAC05374]TDF58822.1 hypothetical protein E2C00_07040 [Streptomyces sp. WAC05374]